MELIEFGSKHLSSYLCYTDSTELGIILELDQAFSFFNSKYIHGLITVSHFSSSAYAKNLLNISTVLLR